MSGTPGSPAAEFEIRDGDATRFWEKARRPSEDDCWEWQSVTSPDGYGKFRVRDHIVNAHRFAYKLENGEIPGDLVLHKCDNRPCVNPAHLESGSQSENLKQAYRRGRIELPDNEGQKNGNAKLTEADVREIKELFLSTNLTDYRIAQRHPVSPATIYNIRVGETWTHVELDADRSGGGGC